MKKQLVIIGIVVLLVSVGLSGCNEISNTVNPEKNKFVGTWKKIETNNGSIIMGTETMDLFSDGKCSFGWLSGTWDLKDGKLVLEVSLDTVITSTYNYTFSNNDKTLTLVRTSGGEPEVYTKQ